ncbi:MAG: Mg2 transporter protein CorA family protein, partial [Candidatus Daviesbacteria bacterium GW2011_GWA1_38_7]
MINIYYRNIKEKALHKLDEFRAGSWIYVEKPTQEEIDQLTKDFGLDEGLLRDATDLFEVPRLEVEDDIVYIYTRFPFSENEQILTSPVLIAAGGNFVLTISDRPLPGLERFLEHKIDFYTTQKVKFLLILFS